MDVIIGKNTLCKSIFRLIGKNEDALTYAFGYILAHNQNILVDFLKKIEILASIKGRSYKKETEQYKIFLQENRDISGGRKDIIIETFKMPSYRIVIEAKIDGSIPDKKQLTKYVTNSKEWNSEYNYLVTLTRKAIPANSYFSLENDSNVCKNNIIIKHAYWYQVLEIVKKYYSEHPKTYNEFIINDFIKFIKEDYQVKYFEYEIISVHILKSYIDNICMKEPKGYYFDGGRKQYTYPECLFFLPCYGQKFKAKKTGEYIRRIDKYEILSAEDISNCEDSNLKEAFLKHQDFFNNIDSDNERIHVFTLGNKISIPERNQKFTGSNREYKKIDEILSN